jgi:hypothetical protein
MASTLELWNKVSALPAGKWTFTRMLCLKHLISVVFLLYLKS